MPWKWYKMLVAAGLNQFLSVCTTSSTRTRYEFSGILCLTTRIPRLQTCVRRRGIPKHRQPLGKLGLSREVCAQLVLPGHYNAWHLSRGRRMREYRECAKEETVEAR
ncbi:hypothetical protein FA95DRAFT_1353780 [Auriscalpium vulgare]|uniref:Uncharacterized protein n=1 Tax=Auriscalpium vulgare TaxID=40419 RepID=A0ACB8R1W9_9AGAM|nr:hypothetical protein FA95DRAFT_1353780 [Auriscalpium vulgare]